MLQKTPGPTRVPTTELEAAEIMREMGALFSEAAQLQAAHDAEVARRYRAVLARIRGLERRGAARGGALYRFWRKYGRHLTESKTLKLLDVGELKERIVEGAMVFRDEAATIARLRQLGRGDLIETKESIKIELLEEEPEMLKKLRGVRKEKRTKFYATPAAGPKRVERDPEWTPRIKAIAKPKRRT